MPIALTIAGSDPSGGAGVQADLKTFHQHRVYGMSVVTLVTAQSTQGVKRVFPLPPDLIGEQLTTVLEDIKPQAIKIGALGSPAVVDVVADILSGVGAPVVLDPVLVSKTGNSLAEEGTGEQIVKKLFPLATIVTPNAHEAAALTGMEVKCKDTMSAAAEKLTKMGTRMVVITAGGIEGPCTDVGFEEGSLTYLPADRIDTAAGHGAGCVFSAAITAHLAERLTPMQALVMAKQFTGAAIRRSPGLGHGRGPLNMFVPV